MKIAYAFRRSVFYPYKEDALGLPGGAARARFLGKVREIGFDGVELDSPADRLSNSFSVI